MGQVFSIGKAYSAKYSAFVAYEILETVSILKSFREMVLVAVALGHTTGDGESLLISHRTCNFKS